MDKGFCCGAIIRYLQQINQATVLACPIRGTLGGTRALCWGRGSYITDYTFSNGTVARLLVAELRVLDPQTRRRQQQWLIFVLIRLDWTPYQVITRYQRRFGIEASYRLLASGQSADQLSESCLALLPAGPESRVTEYPGASALALHSPTGQRALQARAHTLAL